MSSRASASVIGIVLLLLVGVALGSVVAAGAEAVAAATGEPVIANGASSPSASEPGTIALSLRLDGETVVLTHERGDPLHLEDVRVVVAVDGEQLRYQPPVPFFAATGFRGGPTGPFNLASDGVWSAGETGSFRVAGTNDPQLRAGRTVSVTLYVESTRVSRVRGTID